jgi:hypothetical protein
MTELLLEPEQDEKLIVKVDSQIVNAMDLCAERYNLEHVLHMRPLRKAPALEHGGVMHTMLAHYYRQKMAGRIPTEHAQVVEEAVMLGRIEAAQCSFDLKEFEEEDLPIFKAYVLAKQYDGWIIKAVEQPFTKLLYTSAELDILYEGIVDAIVEEPKGEEFVVDHKTESRRSTPFILSTQFTGYSWALDRKMCVNKVGYQTSLPDAERFRRIYFAYTDYMIDEWKRDTIAKIQEAIEWHKTGVFHKNRTSCDKYSGCIYQKVCIAPPELREYKLQAYFYKDKPWDPWTRDNE